MVKRGGNYNMGSDEFEDDTACKQKCWKIFKKNIFLPFLLLGIIAGIIIGVLIKIYDEDFHDDKRSVMYLGFPGALLLRMLKCMIIPLIMTSLISGMAGLPRNSSGRLGGSAVAYYLLTTLLAVLLGILLVCTIKPGEKGGANEGDETRLVHPVDSLLDLIRNALPANIIAACTFQTKTEYTSKDVIIQVENNGTLVNETETEIDTFKVATTQGSNVLGLVVFSIVLGVIVGQMGDAGLPVKLFVDSLHEAIIRIVKLIIWYSPIGICFILAARIAGMEDPVDEFKRLGWYMLTVLVGLAIHGFILLPTIYVIFTRKNPYKLMFHMSQALLTALGTASSAATLPITMHCLEEKAGVDRRVSRFVLPVGATINMDGTALYEAVASIFIAQLNNIPLNAGQIITVSITATAAAIGAAGVPEAGLVTMLIVLTAVGLPTEDVALIFAVDWLLDRFRTTVNVWGDSVGAGVVESISRSKLGELDDIDDTTRTLEDNYHPARKNPNVGSDNPAFIENSSKF